MEHAQLEGRMATSAAEVERLKAAVAHVSQEVPGLKAQLHESVCAQAELQGRLHAAEEEIAAFDARMKGERDELEQTRNKVAALQGAVVSKEKMEVKLARMEEKMGTVSALEAQIGTLSQELADSHSKIAAFEQAAAEARQRKLGPMAAVVPAGLDKWAAMPKSPFSMPAFSVPSWGKRAPEPGPEEVAGGEVSAQQRGIAEGAGDEDFASVGAGGEGMETKERGLDRGRELERERALEDAQLGEGAEEASPAGEDAGHEGLEAGVFREEDGLVVMLRQQLSEMRQARAAAENEAYSLRRELAAAAREAAGDKRVLAGAHRREREQPEQRVEGGEGARECGGGDLADALLQLRMAREEVEGAHEAARVADAAANAAERRARELEHERQADFDEYREREGKSREQVKALADKLAQCEEALGQLKKKLWVKEREAQVLQQQLGASRQEGEGPSCGARADHGGWNSSALRHRAGDEMRELQRRLAATETVLAERTQRLRDVEEQLGVAAESTWAKSQETMRSGQDGHAASGSDRADGAHYPGSLGPDVPAEGSLQDVAPERGDWMDEPLDKREDDVAQVGLVMAPGTSALAAAGSEGLSAGRPQDRSIGLLSDFGSTVTNSVNGLTTRSFGGWSARLPFLKGSGPSDDSCAQLELASSEAVSPGESSAAALAHPLAPPPVSPAPATLPQTPHAIGADPASASPSSHAGDGGLWGVSSTRDAGRARSSGRGAEEEANPVGRSEGAGRKMAESGERWVGARGLVQDAVAESRAVRGFYHELEKEREAAAELAQIRSARGSAGSAGGLRASTGFDLEIAPGAALAGRAPEARSSREWILTESSEEMMDRLRGRGLVTPEEQAAEASLFLSKEWLDGIDGVGEGNSGKTTASLNGPRVSGLRKLDTRESNLWNRSASDVIPSVSSRA